MSERPKNLFTNVSCWNLYIGYEQILFKASSLYLPRNISRDAISDNSCWNIKIFWGEQEYVCTLSGIKSCWVELSSQTQSPSQRDQQSQFWLPWIKMLNLDTDPWLTLQFPPLNHPYNTVLLSPACIGKPAQPKIARVCTLLVMFPNHGNCFWTFMTVGELV